MLDAGLLFVDCLVSRLGVLRGVSVFLGVLMCLRLCCVSRLICGCYE